MTPRSPFNGESVEVFELIGDNIRAILENIPGKHNETCV